MLWQLLCGLEVRVACACYDIFCMYPVYGMGDILKQYATDAGNGLAASLQSCWHTSAKEWFRLRYFLYDLLQLCGRWQGLRLWSSRDPQFL